METVTRQYNAGNIREALQTLKEYDSRLGGFGIYRSDGQKLPGVYRAFSYVEMPL